MGRAVFSTALRPSLLGAACFIPDLRGQCGPNHVKTLTSHFFNLFILPIAPRPLPKESCFLDILWVARPAFCLMNSSRNPCPSRHHPAFLFSAPAISTSWSCLASTREIVSFFSLYLRPTKSTFPGLLGLLTCSVSMETQP